MKKKVSIVIIVIVLAVVARFIYHSMTQSRAMRSIISVLPEDAVYILKTGKLTDTWQEVSSTNIWQHFIKTNGFEYLQSVDTLLDKTLLQSKTSKYIFDNRPTAMAAYVTSSTDYDFIYTVDLQKTAYIKQFLDRLLKLGGRYKVLKLTYNQTPLYKLIDKKDPDNILFITALDNVLIASFSYKLIKKTLKEKDRIHWLMQPAFKEISSSLNHGLMQWYFNYKQLPAFVNIYFKDSGVENISKQLVLSGFDIEHDAERILMNGMTITDSIPSYMNALLDIKPGKLTSYQIVSSQTAMLTSIGFKDFDLFYQSLLNSYAANDKSQKTAYRQALKKMEKYFKIDLQTDLFDWIGQEIALVKIRSDKLQRPADILMIIQSKDIGDARKGLHHISEQIRKRSPFKFKERNYKNFKIHYLHQKGFFKTVLGDLVKKIDKPYYTFIENFVVFSNSEKVLKHFIDDYITGNTLSHDKVFMDFRDEFQNKSNWFTYIQMPKLYDIIKQSLTPEGRKSLNEKQDLILSFSRIGLQMTAKDDHFNTILVIDHDEEALKKEQAEQKARQIDRSVHNVFFEDLQFKTTLSDSLQVADGPYKIYYPDGQSVKAEGIVKNSLPQGIWRSYYKSGYLQSVVNYDEGEVTGDLFYYFDKAGKKLMVETHYDHDMLEGDYLEYWPNGAIKAKLHYKNGKLHGEAIYYYPTGQVKTKGKYRKGKRKGKWRFFDTKGNVTHTKRYSGFLF